MLLFLIPCTVGLLPAEVPATRPAVRLSSPSIASRREAVLASSALFGAAAAPFLLGTQPASALVKGSAPPPKMAVKERKCKSIDECEALGEKERAKAEAGQDTSFERTTGGDRYRDLTVGSGSKAVGQGDTVEIRYRVMRLGTKARDGLSGEGQTIFSFGYGEDEDKEGDKLPVTLAGKNVIPGVNDAILGMKPGGRRRVLVRPERGWREQTGACASGEKSLDLNAQQRNTATDGNLVFKAPP